MTITAQQLKDKAKEIANQRNWVSDKEAFPGYLGATCYHQQALGDKTFELTGKLFGMIQSNASDDDNKQQDQQPLMVIFEDAQCTELFTGLSEQVPIERSQDELESKLDDLIGKKPKVALAEGLDVNAFCNKYAFDKDQQIINATQPVSIAGVALPDIVVFAGHAVNIGLLQEEQLEPFVAYANKLEAGLSRSAAFNAVFAAPQAEEEVQDEAEAAPDDLAIPQPTF